MTNRCENPNHPSHKDYGARGIRVFVGWLGPGGFQRFYGHIGARPSAAHELDRIDNSKGYEPGNVRWATRKQQMSNTRANHWIEIDGAKKTLREWTKVYDIHETTVIHRIARGMTEYEAVTTPARFGGRRASKRAAA
jgi:hypothetical protein